MRWTPLVVVALVGLGACETNDPPGPTLEGIDPVDTDADLAPDQTLEPEADLAPGTEAETGGTMQPEATLQPDSTGAPN